MEKSFPRGVAIPLTVSSAPVFLLGHVLTPLPHYRDSPFTRCDRSKWTKRAIWKTEVIRFVGLSETKLVKWRFKNSNMIG